METAELILDCQNEHGEGVVWNPDDSRLWWTDIQGKMLCWYNPARMRTGTIAMPDRVCCFAPRANGGLILAFAKQLAFFDPATGRTEGFFHFEPDNAETRLNDGRTDRQGNFIAGGMNEVSAAFDSSVVRVTPDGGVATILKGVSCANSTCFSPDGATMYFADSPDKTIRAYDYDPSAGVLCEPRLLIDMNGMAGVPDGSCVDEDGYVWNAVWEGRKVIRVAPDGTVERVIEVPVEKPTCCTFGGDDLDILFITTSRLGSSAEMLAAEPRSGGLFAIKPGIRGLVDAPFAG